MKLQLRSNPLALCSRVVCSAHTWAADWSVQGVWGSLCWGNRARSSFTPQHFTSYTPAAPQRADLNPGLPGGSLHLPGKKCKGWNMNSCAGWAGRGAGELIPPFQAAFPGADPPFSSGVPSSFDQPEKLRQAHSCHFRWVLACIILSIRQCYPLWRIFRLHFKSIRDSKPWSRRAW